MHNSEIIEEELIERGIYTIYEIEEMKARGEDIPYHTRGSWRKLGKEVNDDAIPIEVNLWRKNKSGQFYLKKTFIYSLEQVH